MRSLVLVAAILLLASCRTTESAGGGATADAPRSDAAAEKQASASPEMRDDAAKGAGPGTRAAAPSAPPATPRAPVAAPAAQTAAVIRVNGMSCPLCAHNIELALGKLKGVSDVRIDLGRGEVTAELNGAVSKEAIENAVNASGFTVVDVRMPGEASGEAQICATCDCGNCGCGKSGRCAPDCRCHT
jgi:copper chaperone